MMLNVPWSGSALGWVSFSICLFFVNAIEVNPTPTVDYSNPEYRIWNWVKNSSDTSIMARSRRDWGFQQRVFGAYYACLKTMKACEQERFVAMADHAYGERSALYDKLLTDCKFNSFTDVCEASAGGGVGDCTKVESWKPQIGKNDVAEIKFAGYYDPDTHTVSASYSQTLGMCNEYNQGSASQIRSTAKHQAKHYMWTCCENHGQDPTFCYKKIASRRKDKFTLAANGISKFHLELQIAITHDLPNEYNDGCQGLMSYIADYRKKCRAMATCQWKTTSECQLARRSCIDAFSEQVERLSACFDFPRDPCVYSNQINDLKCASFLRSRMTFKKITPSKRANFRLNLLSYPREEAFATWINSF
ncbi:hypothetical protein Ddc_22478 [Ditylenchus destructor]|nr:hypothetical protein Ddc_22478 [Ditylenchus destructor]